MTPELPLPSPPGVTVQPRADGVELTIPWRLRLTPMLHVLFAVIVLAAVWSLSIWAIPFGTVWLYHLLNRTTVLIRRTGVDISHGPLPTFSPSGFFPASRFRQVSVHTRFQGHRRQAIAAHELRASGHVIIDRWVHSKAVLDYVRECIEAIVEIDGPAPRP